jgi:hypothetical protein
VSNNLASTNHYYWNSSFPPLTIHSTRNLSWYWTIPNLNPTRNWPWTHFPSPSSCHSCCTPNANFPNCPSNFSLWLACCNNCCPMSSNPIRSYCWSLHYRKDYRCNCHQLKMGRKMSRIGRGILGCGFLMLFVRNVTEFG